MTSSIIKTIDPVQGLIDYTLTIKPYHSKIIEVLEEYIHTDLLNVVMDDKIDFCVHLGIPNLNTYFEYTLQSINVNQVTVNGDASHSVNIGQRVEIVYATHNNGIYYVLDVVYNATQNISTITVDTALNDDVVDGKIVHSVINYCPDGLNTSTNVLELTSLVCDDGYGETFDSIIKNVNSIDEIAQTITITGNIFENLDSSAINTIKLIDISVNPNVEIGVFHIDSHVFDGANTIITILEDITTFPGYSNSGTYKTFISTIGYDVSVNCGQNDDPNNAETLFVSMKEEITFDMSISFADSFKVFNMENTYESVYDNIKFGTIVSDTQPALPETTTPPTNPNLFDLWFDTTNNVFKQWFGVVWKPITHAFWYQRDTLDNQNVTHYKIIKNSIEDTGWVQIDPNLNDELLDGYGLEPYASEKHKYFHYDENIVVDTGLNGMFLTGGNFIPLLRNNNTILTYDETSFIGKIFHDHFQVISLSGNQVRIAGDHTSVFVPGVSFIIENPILQNKEFNVQSTVLAGGNTTIIVAEDLSTYNFDDNSVGVIPAILYVQANTFVGINQVSTLFISNTLINSNIDIIEYEFNGPLQLFVDVFRNNAFDANIIDTAYSNEPFIVDTESSPGDTVGASITDELFFEWGDITQWFQYYITQITDLNTIVLAGNASIDIQTNQKIRIIGFTTNAGLYSISNVVFDGVNTTLTLIENLQTLDVGGFVEPEDILPMTLLFEDSIECEVDEMINNSVLDTGGNLITSFDVRYFDVGGFDADDQPHI